MSPFFHHTETSRRKHPNVLNSISQSAVAAIAMLFLLQNRGAAGHLTYLEAMRSGDEQMEADFFQEYFYREDYQDDDADYYQLDQQKLDLNSLQDILDYTVEVEAREEVEKEIEEEPNIRQFALIISRILYRLTKEES